MNEGKDFFASKTTWGAIFLLLGPLLASFGINIGDTTAWVESIVSLVGAAGVVWGQITRATKITSIAGIKVKKS